MARAIKNRPPKKAIYVFWEGESEAAYTKYLRKAFEQSASITSHREKGTFATAKAYCRGNKVFQNNLSELDEIWFFFDTEIENGNQWDKNMKCVESILKAAKRSPVKIRLLMTSCCVEYWFLLHFERRAPAIITPTDKEKILQDVRNLVHGYKKGDYETTAAIARKYKDAIPNGRWTLERLKSDGLPDDPTERDRWLFLGTRTFTTVHEALEMLEALPKL